MDDQPIAFTADLHFGHHGVLALAHGRPFDSIEEHDDTLIERINDAIPQGRLYILGDLGFGGITHTAACLERIRPEVLWLRGNHDPEALPEHLKDLVTWFGDYKTLRLDDGQKIVMSHYPFLEWDGAYRGSWHLHGHKHNLLPPTTQPRMDVGVDTHDFRPWLLDEVREVLRDRTFTPVE